MQCKVEATKSGLMTSTCQLAAPLASGQSSHSSGVLGSQARGSCRPSWGCTTRGNGLPLEGSCNRGVHVFMADPQTSFAADSKQDAVMHVA